MDLTNPKQMHAYTYANANPTTLSDPTGLWTPERGGVPCIDGDCSFHNKNGSLKNKNQCKKNACGTNPLYDPSSSARPPLYLGNNWGDPTKCIDGDCTFHNKDYSIKDADQCARSACGTNSIYTVSPQWWVEDFKARRAAEAAAVAEECWAWSWVCDATDWVDDNWDTIGVGLTIAGFGLCTLATGGWCLLATGAAVAGTAFTQAYDSSDRSFDLGRINWTGVAVDAGLMAAGFGVARLFGSSSRAALTLDIRKSAVVAKDPVFEIDLNSIVSIFSTAISVPWGTGSQDFWK